MAIAALPQSIDAHETALNDLAIDRFFVPLASDPAFSEIRTRSGVPANPNK